LAKTNKTKKAKASSIRIMIPLFNKRVHVFIGDNQEEAKKCVFRYTEGHTVEDRDCKGWCSAGVIWSIDELPIICHEVHHLVRNIVEEVGVRDVETEAYLYEFIISKLQAKGMI
jgi:hypothetical protein